MSVGERVGVVEHHHSLFWFGLTIRGLVVILIPFLILSFSNVIQAVRDEDAIGGFVDRSALRLIDSSCSQSRGVGSECRLSNHGIGISSVWLGRGVVESSDSLK